MSNIAKIVTAQAEGMDAIESALQALLTECDIESAVGAQLNQIGALVGQPRNGLDDDTYRRYCRARIAANRSKGRPLDVFKIARLVVDDSRAVYRYENHGNATCVLRVEGVAVSLLVQRALIYFLKLAKAGGVRVIVETNEVVIGGGSPTVWFQWDTPGAGWDAGYLFDAVD